MRHWSEWSFKKFGITLETRWGNAERDGKRFWAPYQTLFSIGRLRLHCFHRGDGDPHPHDHMWDFWTFPLTSYVEKVYQDVLEDGMLAERQVVRAGRLHYRPAEYRHIVLGRQGAGPGPWVVGGRIWTIVWVGRKRREWGFWTGGGVVRGYDEVARKWRIETPPKKFVPWREYIFGGKR